MKHIRNSKKGVFILQNNGIPNSSFTDFSETIPIGSLCIDSTNQELYSYIGDNYWERVNRNSDRITALNTTPLNNERIDVINGIFVWADSPSGFQIHQTPIRYNNVDITCPESSRLVIDYRILGYKFDTLNVGTAIFERIGSNNINRVVKNTSTFSNTVYDIVGDTTTQSVNILRNNFDGIYDSTVYDIIVEYSFYIHKI